LAFLADQSLFVTPAFLIRLVYQNADGQARSALNMAKLCENLVRLAAVTLEFHLLIFVLLCKNWHIWPIIAEHTGSILTTFSALVDMSVM